jgi:hypothetical protein
LVLVEQLTVQVPPVTDVNPTSHRCWLGVSTAVVVAKPRVSTDVFAASVTESSRDRSGTHAGVLESASTRTTLRVPASS